MKPQEKKNIRIVILGAGFGGVHTLKYLHKIRKKNISLTITVVNKNNYFLFTPLLHEVATGGICGENIIEPLRNIFHPHHDDLYRATVKKVNVAKKTVETTLGSIQYDYLVYALGSKTNFFGVPGAEKHCFQLKTLENALCLKNHFIEMFECAAKLKDSKVQEELLRFVLVGGGPTSVELATEMSDFFYDSFAKLYTPDIIQKVKIIIIQREDELLPQFPPLLRKKSLKVVNKKKIEVRFNTVAVGVEKNGVTLDTGEFLPSATVIWVGGIIPNTLTYDKSPLVDTSGKLRVNEYLQLQDHPEVFALGDAAVYTNPGETHPVPTLAQVAMKQAKSVAENIHASIIRKPPKAFIYRQSGIVVSLGRWRAVGQIGSCTFFGRCMWLLWRIFYVSKLLSWHKRIRVLFDWTLDIFLPRDISEL